MFIELTIVKNEEKFLVNLSCLIFISSARTGCCIHTFDSDTFYVKEAYEYLCEVCRAANEVEKT